MNQILNKYKKSAYLSFQLIVHYKHLQINDTNIVLFLDAKHIKDLNYQPIVITVQKDVDFNKLFKLPLCTFVNIFMSIICMQHHQIERKTKRLLSVTL